MEKLNKYDWKYKTIFYVLLIIIFILFLTSLHFSFGQDEGFTMGLIHHNYLDIIRIDQLDVHPPLYYLLLKCFLQLTTFWTTSIFIKIIFARLLSVIIGIVGFYFLHKIVKNLGIKVDWRMQLLLYLSIPGVLNYFTSVRMYELAAVFIILEFYELILSYNKYRNILNTSLAIIFASLAAYTHYFAAVSAGLFIFTFFITSIFYKNKHKIIKYFVSGIAFLLLYLPLVPFTLIQFKYETNQSVDNNNLLTKLISSFTGIINNEGLLKKIFIILLLFGFIYVIFWGLKYLNEYFNIIFINVLINIFLTVFLTIFMAIFKGSPFNVRYIYPIFSLYSFFIISIICTILEYYLVKQDNCVTNLYNIKKVDKFIISFTLLLLVFSNINLIKANIKTSSKSSIKLVHDMNKFSKTKNKDIYVNISDNYIFGGASSYVTQYSVYLKSLNKNLVIHSNDIDSVSNLRKAVLAHDNKELFDKVFENIIIKSKY